MIKGKSWPKEELNENQHPLLSNLSTVRWGDRPTRGSGRPPLVHILLQLRSSSPRQVALFSIATPGLPPNTWQQNHRDTTHSEAVASQRSLCAVSLPVLLWQLDVVHSLDFLLRLSTQPRASGWTVIDSSIAQLSLGDFNPSELPQRKASFL